MKKHTLWFRQRKLRMGLQGELTMRLVIVLTVHLKSWAQSQTRSPQQMSGNWRVKNIPSIFRSGACKRTWHVSWWPSPFTHTKYHKWLEMKASLLGLKCLFIYSPSGNIFVIIRIVATLKLHCGPEDAAQLVQCLPCMSEALGSIPSTT